MKRHQQGVTLIELAVVLAIVAILLSQAGSYFAAWTQNAQIRTASESIQNGLQLARSEAIRRNRSVMFWLTSTASPQPADWLVGCKTPVGAGVQPEATGDCPGTHTSAAPTAYNWIQRQLASDQQTSLAQVTAVDSGGAAATNVTFNSLGLVTLNDDGSNSIVQIDVNIPSLPTSAARPLRVTISGGQIRMCDPALSPTTDPRGC
jgi:type IV fimbrial biogenesis protein FimT